MPTCRREDAREGGKSTYTESTTRQRHKVEPDHRPANLPHPLFPRPAFQFHPIATSCGLRLLLEIIEAPDKTSVRMKSQCALDSMSPRRKAPDWSRQLRPRFNTTTHSRQDMLITHFGVVRCRDAAGAPTSSFTRMHEMNPPLPCYPPSMQVICPCLCFSSTLPGASLS